MSKTIKTPSRSPKTSTSLPPPTPAGVEEPASPRAEIFSITMDEAATVDKLLEYLTTTNTHIPMEFNAEGITIHQGAAADTGKRKGGRGASKKYQGDSPILNVARIYSSEVTQWHCNGIPEGNEHIIMVDGTRLRRSIASVRTKTSLRLYAKEGENVLRYATSADDDSTIQLLVDTTNHAEAEYEFGEEHRMATKTAEWVQSYCDTIKTLDDGQRIVIRLYEGGMTFTAKIYGLEDSHSKNVGNPITTATPLDTFAISSDIWKHLGGKITKMSYPKAAVKFYAKRSDSGVGVLRIVIKLATFGELSIYVDEAKVG